MVVSFNNDSVKGINVHNLTMASSVGVNFSIIVCLAQLILELDEVLLLSYSSSLGNFSQSSSVIFEEHTASLYDRLEFAFSDRFDGDLLYLVDLDEVDQSADTVLVIDSLSFRVDDAVLLLRTSEDPSQVVQRDFSVLRDKEQIVLSTKASV